LGTLWNTAKVLGPIAAFGATLFGDLFRQSDPHRGEASEIQTGNSPFIADVGEIGVFDLAEMEEDAARRALENEAAAVATAQDWWDARNKTFSDPTLANIAEEDKLFAEMQTLFGDKFDGIMDSINDHLGEVENPNELEDIPSGWFNDVLDSMTWEDTGELTSDDVSGFAALPGDIEEAVANGIATGTANMSVNIDGQKAGYVLAPYISREIAVQMIN
jgi:hypothetical protein